MLEYSTPPSPPQGTLERDDWERLPLHYAVLGNAPAAVVEALAKAYPEAVVAKDDLGEDTPLDLARKKGSSAENPNLLTLTPTPTLILTPTPTPTLTLTLTLILTLTLTLTLLLAR